MAVRIALAVVVILRFAPLRQAFNSVADASESVKSAAEQLVPIAGELTGVGDTITEASNSLAEALESAASEAEGVGDISVDSDQLAGDVALMLTTLNRIANALDPIAN